MVGKHSRSSRSERRLSGGGCFSRAAGMNGGLNSLRVDPAGAVRTALVSAENLHFTLETGISQEEQALTRAKPKPKETPKAGYSSAISWGPLAWTGTVFLRPELYFWSV